MRSRHRLTEHLIVFGAQLGLALLVAACSGAADGPSTAIPEASPEPPAPSPAEGSPTITVEMCSDGDARVFRPDTLTVPKGATVVWQHVSGSGHTATADPAKATDPSHAALPPGAEPWDSGTLSNGQTFARTFEVPGTYRYFCAPHEERGMLRTLVVTAASQ